MGTQSNALVELTALRGLSPRHEHRLTLEALVAGTLYDQALNYDWAQDQDSAGAYRKARDRRPLVQSGLAAEKFRGLLDKLVGRRVFPAVGGADGTGEGVVEALSDVVKAMGLAASLPRCAEGLLYGSGVMGFHWLDGAGRLEDAGLDATWATPIYTAQADGPAANALAARLSEYAPEHVEHVPSEDGRPERWRLRPADGDPDSLDLAALVHEWRVDSEVKRGDGIAADTMITWYRRVYLPHVIIEYHSITIGQDTDRPPRFEPVLPLEPHGWGLIPAVWVTPALTRPGAIDGPSFLSPQVRSLAQAADYTESHTQTAADYSCAPQLLELDVESDTRTEASLHATASGTEIPATPTSVIQMRTSGSADHQGSVTLLEATGDGPAVGHSRLEHLARRVADLTGVIANDPDGGGVLSGTALKRRLEPTLARVDAYRGPLEDGVVLLVSKALRVLGLEGAGIGVGEVVVSWPEIVEPTAEDILALANAFGAAAAQGVFPRAAAVREFAARLGRDDGDKLAAEVEGEEAKRVAQAVAMVVGGVDE